MSCYSVDEIIGVSFTAEATPSLDVLDSEQIQNLIKSIRQEIFEISGMKSSQRIAALEIVYVPDERSQNLYQLRFFILPAATDENGQAIDVPSSEVISIFDRDINHGQFLVELEFVKFSIQPRSMQISENQLDWVPEDGTGTQLQI